MKYKKDAYYFPHFCNARSDRKIKRLRKDLGVEGYGIFFMILEILREQPNFKYPLRDIDLLEDDLQCSLTKIKAVIFNYDLFEILDDNNFISIKFIYYLQPYLEKSARAQKAASIRWGNANSLNPKELKDIPEAEIIEKNNAKAYANVYSNANANAMLEQCKSECKESKVKESKVNNTKEDLEIELKNRDNLYSPEQLKIVGDEDNENDSNDKKEVKFSEEGMKFAIHFKTLLPEDRRITESDLKNWAKVYDQLQKIEKLTKEQIWKICYWARKDSFWKDNFLSPLKLRKKDSSGVMYIEIFKIKMESEQNEQSKRASSGTNGTNTSQNGIYAKKHNLNVSDVEESRRKFLASRIANGSGVDQN